MDSAGDGVGDLAGIRQRLDYLEWLGVDALWLNPITPSPNADWGYDVSSYCDVHPDLGSMDDLDLLIKDAADRDIAVVLDLVPNHTSDRHPWFLDARSSRSAAHRDWYVWADPAPDGGPPNNWRRALGSGPAWTFDERTGQYYMHNFLPQQPDLNWWNEEVRDAFDDILRFWFDRGVSGFRVDVVHALIHDPQLRGNPPTGPEDHPQVVRIGQRQIYNANRPEVHNILRRWRRICDGYDPPRVLVGETYLFELADVASYYGSADELHLAFNFPFIFSIFSAAELSTVVGDTMKLLPRHAAAAWAASNHDVGRVMTRWCDGDERRARCAMLLLLTLPGTAFLYYGDEIGMEDVSIPRDERVDPAGVMNWPAPGRDRCRTPMQWEAQPGGGFTAPTARPWHRLGDYDLRNVADQIVEDDSLLHLTRNLVALRRSMSPTFVNSSVTDGVMWTYSRPPFDIALNLGDVTHVISLDGRAPLLATDGRVTTDAGGAQLRLAPWSGAVLRREVVQ